VKGQKIEINHDTDQKNQRNISLVKKEDFLSGGGLAITSVSWGSNANGIPCAP